MTPTDVLRELVGTARRLGIAVRHDKLGDEASLPGGFCTVRGQPLVVIDPAATLEDQIAILTEVLRTYDLEGVYLPPFVRAHLAR